MTHDTIPVTAMILSSESTGRPALDSFFTPASIAIVGATDRVGSVGHSVLTNVLRGRYRGRVYPVNPKRG